MKIKIILTIVNILVVVLNIRGQQLRFTVTDQITKESLPFASIFNKSKNIGVLANGDGLAIISASPGDSIQIKYLGYIDKTISLTEIKASEYIIELEALENELGEVVVFANDNALYTAIKEVKKQIQSQKKFSSKSFLQIEPDYSKKPLELVQGFYNAYVEKGVIKEFKFKNGRVGLMHDKGRYFVSLNTSKVISSFQLLNENSSFEDGIFCMSDRKVRKHYELQKIFDSASKLQGITFTPKSKNYWKGEIWFEEDFQPKKIIYEILGTQKVPFYAIHGLDTIGKTNIKIELNYESNELYLLNFSYSFQYYSKRDYVYHMDTIHTQGSIHLFDKKLFHLPWMENIEEHNDYRKISFLSWNRDFWNNISTPELTTSQLTKMAYFEKEGKILNFKARDVRSLHNYYEIDGNFFSHNNITWSANDRWTLSPIEKPENEIKSNEFAKLKYDIKVDIIVDVNEVNGKLITNSVSIIDVFNSKWFLPNETKYNRFLSIYFDLCEIERQKMQTKLETLNATNIKDIEKIYFDTYRSMQKLLVQYRLEVDTGKDEKAMKKWNEIVKEELGVDNFSLLPIVELK